MLILFQARLNLEPSKTIIEFMIKNILSPATLYIAAYQVSPKTLLISKWKTSSLKANGAF